MNSFCRSLVKTCLSFLYHPVLSTYLYVKGARRFYIGPRMMVNNITFLHIGNFFYLGRDSRFLFIKQYRGKAYQPSVEIGDKVSIGQRFSLLSGAPITIGSNTIIASDVLITSQNHGIDPERTESYSATDLQVKAVFIGKGCWIGEKCSILPGVELGNRVIVAAGSVVTKSFPDACMVAGVPAKIIKKYNWTNHTWEKV